MRTPPTNLAALQSTALAGWAGSHPTAVLVPSPTGMAQVNLDSRNTRIVEMVLPDVAAEEEEEEDR